MNLRWFLDHPPRAWATQNGLRPVTVAVVDSGIDSTHPALAGRVLSATAFAKTDPRGPIAATDHAPPCANDDCGHGTAVAGVIAALAPNARIADVRVLTGAASAADDLLVAGFQAALASGAEIINLSLVGGASVSRRLHTLCEYAYRRGQIVVAARSNLPLDDNGFPAEFSSVLAVDAEDLPDALPVVYRAGHAVEFAANGLAVDVPAPGGRYARYTGTSFATPAVSALAALARGLQADLTAFELKTIFKAHGRRPLPTPG